MSDQTPVAIVTGGAQGIGAAITERLALDGMRIAIVDQNADGAERTAARLVAAGHRAIALDSDVADEVSVESTVDQVVERLGAPTVLVNNAGVLRDNLIFKMKADEWDTIMQVHLRGAFLMSRAVQRHMVAAGYGRVVNLSSTSALGNRGQTNYAAAKAGIQGFTKALALELGQFGVTVNAVAPGFIATDMTRLTAKRIGVSFDELQQTAAAAAAVRRVGTPQDVAAAVSFFARPDAGFVSGQVLYVAGGPYG